MLAHGSIGFRSFFKKKKIRSSCAQSCGGQAVIRVQGSDPSGLPRPRPELLGGSQEIKASPGQAQHQSLPLTSPHVVAKDSRRPNTSTASEQLVGNSGVPLMGCSWGAPERRLSCQNERDGGRTRESRSSRMSDVQCSGVSALQNDSR